MEGGTTSCGSGQAGGQEQLERVSTGNPYFPVEEQARLSADSEELGFKIHREIRLSILYTYFNSNNSYCTVYLIYCYNLFSITMSSPRCKMQKEINFVL